MDVNIFESKRYSQHGEDGILRAIFYKIGVTDKFCVEFGVGDGSESCTRLLVEKEGWRSLWLDSASQAKSNIMEELLTPENINQVFRKYDVPSKFDLLSIDVDYNTYWLWKAIINYVPRVVVVEYNGFIPPHLSWVVEYSPTQVWDGSQYFGASLLALARLGNSKGYTLIGCDSSGTNAFFVRDELAGNFKIKGIQGAFRPAISDHRDSARQFLEV
jgi:hypothetical protein